MKKSHAKREKKKEKGKKKENKRKEKRNPIELQTQPSWEEVSWDPVSFFLSWIEKGTMQTVRR